MRLGDEEQRDEAFTSSADRRSKSKIMLDAQHAIQGNYLT